MSDRKPCPEAAYPMIDSVQTTAIPSTSGAIELCLSSFASMKREVLDEAKILEETYNLKRSEMSDLGFCNLNFRLRKRNENNIQAEWYLSHFKNGMRTGTTNIKKNRGSHSYDLRLLKMSSPKWMHSLIEETEIQARIIRKKFETIAKIQSLLTSLASLKNENKEGPGIQKPQDYSYEEIMKNLF